MDASSFAIHYAKAVPKHISGCGWALKRENYGNTIDTILNFAEKAIVICTNGSNCNLRAASNIAVTETMGIYD